MKMKSLALWLAVPFAFSSVSALAADLEWSGTYRIEGVFIKDSEASSGKGTEKSYGLHHLILRPKIVASDNLTIYSQFNLFSNSAFPNSQLGQYFGNGPQGAGAANSVDDSNTLGDHEKSEELLITQLYLSMTQEYGALVAGRVPLQFGLGATHNAGNGLFDHWFDTRDLVGYKFIMGNLFFLPMVGKKHEGVLNHSDDVSSYIFHFQYDNYETNLSMGVFYEMNTANDQASQGPTGSFPGAVAGQTGKLNEKTVSIFALKETDLFRLGVEAGFQSGETGMKTAADKNITWDGFGVVGEFEYRPQGSLWKYGALAGYVSGDDPDTDGKFEGFVLDRNYDVAFLLFNHQLGQDDFFGTKGFGGGGSTTGNQQPDVEAVSNAMYLAPYARYQWSDNWAMGTKLATGWLVQNPLSGKDVKKDLGYELDLSLEYSPKKGVKWVNEVGYLFTGDAFKGGGQYDANNVMGVSTKAAISF